MDLSQATFDDILDELERRDLTYVVATSGTDDGGKPIVRNGYRGQAYALLGLADALRAAMQRIAYNHFDTYTPGNP